MKPVFPERMSVKEGLMSLFAFFEIMNIPISRSEISHYFPKKPDESKIDIYLKESPLIVEHAGFYALKSQKNIFADFKKRRKLLNSFWRKINRWSFIFAICPFLESVMICNSVSFGNIKKHSDIDIFIICKSDKIFTARFFVTLITQLFGLRRHGKKIKKRFCLSFYISESQLSLRNYALKPHDIYLAHWVRNLEPIRGDYEKYSTFIRVNHIWLKDYFNEIVLKKTHFKKTSFLQNKIKQFFENILANEKIEEFMKTKQMSRINEKRKNLPDKSGTLVNETVLKFHDQDQRADIQKEWDSKMQNIISSP